MAKNYAPRHSDHWPAGAVVTLSIGGKEKTGKVVRLPRKADGQLFTMVQIDGAGDDRIGQRIWPDGWVLGAGRFSRVCLGCQQPFRTNDDEADFCPMHDDSDQRSTDALSQGHRRALLRGNATRTTAPPVGREDEAQRGRDIAQLRAQDDSERPF
jgi:hypothetical protein